MKTVILAGGKGLRYNNSDVPKPLAKIGNKPIIQHVMDIYSNQGFNDFILCLGYKKEKIIDYFGSINHNYNIISVDTGEESNTGERIRLIQDYIPIYEKDFFVTYSDGLACVDLNKLCQQHKNLNSIVTLTAVRPHSPFGIIDINFFGRVTKFNEKAKMRDYINAGFFVFEKNIFNHITNNNEDLEIDILPRLVYEGKLGAYKHNDWFDTLNSPKDEIRLNELYIHYMKTNMKLPWYK
jgi:glucose-1-phosphate cytidylyltransferase